MHRKQTYLIICLLSCSLAFLQEVRPQPGAVIPQIDTLSVIENGGQEVTTMAWNMIPGVDGYIIFHHEWQGPNLIWYGIDTTYADTDTVYTDPNADPAVRVEEYRIGVLDRSISGNFSGAFGMVHATMHATAVFNACDASVQLSWTQYLGWTEGISQYHVYGSVDGGPYSLLGSQEATDTTFSYSGLDAYRDYCFRVRAVSALGRTSRSNTICIESDMPNPPAYINADFATVDEGTIRLSFHIDPAAETESYKLLRRQAGRPAFDTIHTFPTGTASVLEYTDPAASPDRSWEYKLAALNACGRTVALSNPAGNLHLQLRKRQMAIELSWNAYREWLGGTQSYTLYRSIGGQAFEEIATLDAGDTTYLDDISPFRTQAVSGTFCYAVVAAEAAGNPYGINGLSRSQEICTSLKTDIVFPNAIVPNSEIPENRVFKPVFSFYPEEYYLVIYNRWNNKVFETRDPDAAWDGSLGNGAAPREGVFIYYCRLVGADGSVVERNGQVTVLFRK